VAAVKLRDLDPHFLKIVDAKLWRFKGEDGESEVSIKEADGIVFMCPKCFATNGGLVGTHSVICWRPQVSQDIPPGPGRWEFQGTGYADLTLVAGSSSVALKGGCEAHFFVRNGEIIGC